MYNSPGTARVSRRQLLRPVTVISWPYTTASHCHGILDICLFFPTTPYFPFISPFLSLSILFPPRSLAGCRVASIPSFLPPLRSILRVTKPFVRPATRLAPQQCRTSLIIPRQVHHSWGWPLCRNNFYEERSNVRGFLGKLIYNSSPPPPRQERLVSTRRRNFEQYKILFI